MTTSYYLERCKLVFFNNMPLIKQQQLIELTCDSLMSLAQLLCDYYKLIAPLLNLDYITLTVVISIMKVGLTRV